MKGVAIRVGDVVTHPTMPGRHLAVSSVDVEMDRVTAWGAKGSVEDGGEQFEIVSVAGYPGRELPEGLHVATLLQKQP